MDSSAESHAPGTYLGRAIALFRLVYVEIQYWMVGITLENYHWVKASAWEQFGDLNRTAKHLEAYLKEENNPRIRAWLAYAYCRLGQWAGAEREYSQALHSWRHPSVMLALAEANHKLGNTLKARELADLAEIEFPVRERAVDEGLKYLRDALGERMSKEGAG